MTMRRTVWSMLQCMQNGASERRLVLTNRSLKGRGKGAPKKKTAAEGISALLLMTITDVLILICSGGGKAEEAQVRGRIADGIEWRKPCIPLYESINGVRKTEYIKLFTFTTLWIVLLCCLFSPCPHRPARVAFAIFPSSSVTVL